MDHPSRRNLFFPHLESLARCKALVRDRGSQFTAAIDEVFRTEQIKVLKTSAWIHRCGGGV